MALAGHMSSEDQEMAKLSPSKGLEILSVMMPLAGDKPGKS